MNAVTLEAKVIDYTKVAKVIEASKTIETVNELGHASVFTTNTKATISSEEFTTVYSAAVKIAPVLSSQTIKSVTTTVHQQVKEYTIVTVDNGIVSQFVLTSDIATGEVTVLSQSQTSVATEIVSTLVVQETVKLTIEDIQSSQITEISSVIVKEATLEHATIVSGSVSQN